MFNESSIEFAKIFLVYGSKKETGFKKIRKAIKKTVKKIPKALNIPVPKPNSELSVPMPPGFSEKDISGQIPASEQGNADLGQIQELVDDFSITMIQCDGPNIPLKITKDKQTTNSDIILSEEEISKILSYFSEKTGQPVIEPVFQTKIGNLKIMAITSNYSGSRFIISRQ